ncbi:MAG TPA: NAD-dependent epimerase/dehydratase family protein [Candidatus Sulfotelmatobacter sp.]|nr:NAD-dependent epimerase/dehydratase family protein [Candidatus Sulfotelmatobacter sp.]
MLEHIEPTPRDPARVVVIGAGGFVGGTIARALDAARIDVLRLTRREVDLLAPGAADVLRAMLRPTDSVVAVSALAPAKNNAMLMQNLQMAHAMCEAVSAVPPAHLVYVSSDAIYADDANPVTEQSPAAPSTIHGMMHAARELMLRSASPAPFAALRPTLIYGAADPHSGYGPNRFRRQALKGEPITIFGEGEERRDHVLVDDVAALAILLLRRRSVGALNAVTGTSVAFCDVAGMVAAQFSPAAQVLSVPRPGPRPHLLHRHFDVTNCLKAFPGFRYTSLAEGIARVHRAVTGRPATEKA